MSGGSLHAPFLLRAEVLICYLLATIAAEIFSLLCSVQFQNSDHSAQFLVHLLIQERSSTYRAGICLRWQVRANSTRSCNLLTQYKNSHFNLFCHENLKPTVVRGVSVGRGCSNTYYGSLAMWNKKESWTKKNKKKRNKKQKNKKDKPAVPPRLNRQDRQEDL